MTALYNLHVQQNVTMGRYNGKKVPSCYHTPEIEYKAVRENALLVDYSHLSIVRVNGDDAWSVVNHLVSADISIIRDEQGLYTLILDENGLILGDAYVLCTDEGYYILSENLSAEVIIQRLNSILATETALDIQEEPDIASMDSEAWGALLLEGPYSWEVLSQVYGFDIVGLPYHEYMNTDDGLMVFRCGKHGEFAYLLIGEKSQLASTWTQLLTLGEPFNLKTGGLDYQKIIRVENPCWDADTYQAFSRCPVELQMQWAVQYDKEDFVGKAAISEKASRGATRRLVGMMPLSAGSGIALGDKVMIADKEVGIIVKSAYSFASRSDIILALIDNDYAYSDIDGFDIHTVLGKVASRTHNMPFLHNFSLLVSPTEHSYIDDSKPKSSL
ncbi:aminomethyltransferase family protein [Utexia brackfieldae]|uniref:aminomethyltransferase family protein n=1 Tax=Utexia brackfieldae TaxID=3074108 RepID=UPI00370D54BD